MPVEGGLCVLKPIVFHTTISIQEGKLDRLLVLAKYPYSDFRQSIQFLDSTPSPDKKEFVSRGSYELFVFTFTRMEKSIEINSRFNVSITAKPYAISNSPFPLTSIPESLNYYLQSTPLVESDSPEIRNIGENITALTKKQTEALYRIFRYFANNIKGEKENPKRRQTALETLHTQRGSCEDISHLFSAICRATRIPARTVLGFSKLDTIWGRHAWNEIYDPQFGWFPVDLSAKQMQAGFVDANHLKLLTSLDCSESEVKLDTDLSRESVAPVLILDHSLSIDDQIIHTQLKISGKEKNLTRI